MDSSGPKPSLIVVVGPTASGKSNLALKIALEFKGEIICADSRTIYRGMDIGTAKPLFSEQQKIKHYLLDVTEPGEVFSVADFQKLAQKAVGEIQKAGALPVVTGGTGLYIDALLFDYDFAGDRAVHNTNELEGFDLPALQAKATELGMEVPSGTWLNPRHLRSFIARGGTARRRTVPDKTTLVVGLRPDRATLYRRIEQRVGAMFEAGLLQEVEGLARAYGWDNEAMTGIGYREFKPYFDEVASLEQVKAAIVQNTKAYAKRQLTWFKRHPFIQWFDSPEAAYTYICERLQTS